MTIRNSPEIIASLLATKPKVVITMHRNPDGDAVGSSLGWSRVLANMEIETTVMAPDNFPDFLKWLPGADAIVVFENSSDHAQDLINNCDLIFCLDFNAPSRMGKLENAVVKAKKPIVVVDHHQQPEAFAQAYYVDDTASSTAEMIYRLTKALSWKKLLDRQAAICLYTGIITDTGSFRFSSVSPKLMRMAAKLMETGMDHTQIYNQVYDSNTEERLRLTGFALSQRLVVLHEMSTAYIYMNAKDLQKFSYQKGDTEGLVNYALSIKGVNLAAFFSEKDGLIKISLRSKGKYNVNLLARNHFDGGGHINAAGGKSELSMQNTLKKFEDLIKDGAERIRAAS